MAANADSASTTQHAWAFSGADNIENHFSPLLNWAEHCSSRDSILDNSSVAGLPYYCAGNKTSVTSSFLVESGRVPK